MVRRQTATIEDLSSELRWARSHDHKNKITVPFPVLYKKTPTYLLVLYRATRLLIVAMEWRCRINERHVYVSDVKSNDNKTGVQRWEVDSSPSLTSHICTLKESH